MLLVSLINYAVSYRLQGRVMASADGVEKAAQDLKVLAEVLDIMEGEAFAAELLRKVRASLEATFKERQVAASAAVKKLERVYDWLEDRRNGF